MATQIEISTKQICVGAKVMWRGSWGHGVQKEAVIESIDLCEDEGDKYGIDVPKVWAKDKDRCAFGLTNGHWAYGHQIDLLEESLTQA